MYVSTLSTSAISPMVSLFSLVVMVADYELLALHVSNISLADVSSKKSMFSFLDVVDAI